MPAHKPSPEEYAKELLISMESSTYQQKYSNDFSFEKQDKINSNNLASKTGLEEKQICLNIEDNLIKEGFKLEENKIISYSEEIPLKTKIAGICAKKEDFSEENFLQNYFPMLSNKEFDFVESSCSDYCIDNQKCCVMFLIKSDE